mmetsp:Transcript_32490/g.94122  ORF Transcript_32490/g.94122 Transcript_32490/m.94122 type:complete len:281 (-) Transcript_32490:391-1233(-)
MSRALPLGSRRSQARLQATQRPRSRSFIIRIVVPISFASTHADFLGCLNSTTAGQVPPIIRNFPVRVSRHCRSCGGGGSGGCIWPKAPAMIRPSGWSCGRARGLGLCLISFAALLCWRDWGLPACRGSGYAGRASVAWLLSLRDEGTRPVDPEPEYARDEDQIRLGGFREKDLVGHEQQMGKRGAKISPIYCRLPGHDRRVVDLSASRAIDLDNLLPETITQPQGYDRLALAKVPRAPPKLRHGILAQHRLEPRAAYDIACMNEPVEHKGRQHEVLLGNG